MATFEPWVGNSNPTAQNKNDYIRRLKEALSDVSVTGVESGTYTGDGSATQTITLSNQNLTPHLVIVNSLNKASASMHINFGTSDMSGTSFSIVATSGTPSIVSSSITNYTQGSITVGGSGATDLNTSAAEFGYVIIGTIT